jgi:hypothetical protein
MGSHEKPTIAVVDGAYIGEELESQPKNVTQP